MDWCSKLLKIFLLLSLNFTTSWADEYSEPFPSAPVNTLSGKLLQFPNDLPAMPSLFIIGFSKASQEETQPWLNELSTKYPAECLTVYGVSVLESVPRFIRGVVTRSIRNSVPEDFHDNFLLVTQHAHKWEKMAGFSDDAKDAAYVVLSAHKQLSAWRFHGSADANNQTLLEGKIAELIARRGSCP